jgi:hypothetical protein
VSAEDVLDAIWYAALKACNGLMEAAGQEMAEGRRDAARDALSIRNGVLLLVGMIDAGDGPDDSVANLVARGGNVLEARARLEIAAAGMEP